jgi:hypothetical protein
MAANKFKVKKSVWDEWSSLAQSVFNESFSFFSKNQDKMIHPRAPKIDQALWKTAAWNAAWVAANCVDGIEAKVID